MGRWGSLLAALGLLATVLTGMGLVGDLREAWGLVQGWRWPALAFLPLLGLLDHTLRFLRWAVLLKRIAPEGSSFSWGRAFLLFTAGSLLVFTPGRAGEVAKSVYASEHFHIPMASSVPVLVVERLVDIGVMAFLAGLGLFVLGDLFRVPMVGLLLGLALATLGVLFLILRVGAHRRWTLLREGSPLASVLRLANESGRRLLTPGSLSINAAVGFLAWSLEVVIYFLSLLAVGAAPQVGGLVLALAAFPLASLGGSLTFLPGGLGATEGGLTALGILLGGLPSGMSLAAALLSRATILGTVVIVGLTSLALLRWPFRPVEKVPRALGRRPG